MPRFLHQNNFVSLPRTAQVAPEVFQSTWEGGVEYRFGPTCVKCNLPVRDGQEMILLGSLDYGDFSEPAYGHTSQNGCDESMNLAISYEFNRY